MVSRKSPREIELMRAAGRVVAEALDAVTKTVAVGVTTDALDRLVDRLILERGGTPAFKGYRGFPRSICASVNEEVVHGIPGPRPLAAGDIISVDVGVRYAKYFADAAVTLPIGSISKEAQRLLAVTQEALRLALAVVKPGSRVSDISRTVQQFVEKNGYSVVRRYTGHGIGRKMHEDPQVPNFVSRETLENDEVLQPGMTLAIEPMVNQGTFDTDVLKNKWTVVTKDRKLSAHFEHTVAVAQNGVDILTL
ncbi:MAG: type I methionyl aminopeptidase [Planctomycetes bacterium]|nr:type I methionyl aminopeptidase [Planctomycetota bacterium]MBM4078170.1 type I methionyl aminopeptidase [Planctomycetota bacterium]MBM4083369.1 type I methionyl aminopeptidase [Planctomycetota bacterium]